MQLTGRVNSVNVKGAASTRGTTHVCARPAARAYRALPQQNVAAVLPNQLAVSPVNRRAAVLVRSSPAPASSGLKAPGQHLQQVTLAAVK
jgi:hypothetical protein